MYKVNQQSNHLINWIGGKRLLRKPISELIPNNIGSYIEPFGGGGWILFYKEKWAKNEVYNDLDNRLYNLFNIVKYHPEALCKELELAISSRSLFNRSFADAGVTDIQKAAAFFYVITRSYGGKGCHFGYTVKDSIKSTCNLLDRIIQISKRLDRVIIENLDFETLINKYDFDNAFFYCDPPYTTGQGYKTTSCKDFEHQRLYKVLSRIKGKFLLSYNDSEMIRELYQGFSIQEVSRKNTLNSSSRSDYKELLIKNY